MNITDKEVLSLIGLLHDIGKIMNIKSKNIKEDTLDILNSLNINIIETEEIKQKINDLYLSNEENKLSKIIFEVHNYLTGKEKLDNEYTYSPMKSLFSDLDIGLEKNKREGYYKPSKFSHENAFPVKKEEINPNEISTLKKEVINELNAVGITGDFNSIYVILYTILKKYTWAIPAETDDNTISLFEHAKLTSALSNALYDYRMEKNDDEKPFIIIGGDLSGIQDYLYDISHVGQGGVAKKLRARSFFISVLSDVIVHRMLHELDLNIANILISTGGKFYLLAANTDKTKGFIDDFSYTLNNWLLEEFQGEIHFSLDYQALSGKDIRDFVPKFDSLNDQLELSKKQKFKSVLSKNQSYKLDEQYGKNSDLCASCRKLWASNNSENCIHCNNDLKIGRYLVNCKYIAFSKDKPDHKQFVEFFKDNIYYVSFITDNSQLEQGDYYLVLNINDTEILPNYPSSFKEYANYIPTFSNYTELEEHCKVCNSSNCDYKEQASGTKIPYLFSCLANESVADRKNKGLKSLGVLKADVDRLGAIFSIGLGFEDISITKISSMSRMINYFFAGYLQKVFSDSNKLKYHGYDFDLSKNYIVYAGGDDLLIIGPWDNVTLTASFINNQFRKYTCKNDNITLSSGIALVKERYPIARSSKLATRQEENAKNNGRNSFSIFNEAIKWEDFNLELGKMLDDNQYNGNFSLSFIYRLLTYYEMNKKYKETGDAKYLQWYSKYYYDKSRNFKDKAEKEVEKLGKILIDDKGIDNLKVALHWSIYRNRS